MTDSPQSTVDTDGVTAAPEPYGQQWFRLARACDQIVSGVRPRSLRERLARLVESGVDLDGRGDMYGDGPVTLLEERVAGLLGKPSAVFFATGTMAQQVALRCWAERTGSPTVALHPLSHLETYERRAFQTLSQLRGVWPTHEPRPPTADEIRDLDEPFGTLLLELPLREPGFLLPTWAELVDTVAAARDRGARVHFDGARLWETTHHFGQELAVIAGLADSVYVSFYKTLGGISGAMLAGPAEFIASARAWRHRYGGNIFQQWPAILTALDGLDTELPLTPSYVEHAAVVAAALAEMPGARIYPAVPHTHQFQLWLPHPADALNAAAVRLAEDHGIWFAGRWSDKPPTGYAYTEITVAAPALALTPADITSAATAFLAALPH